MERATMKAYKYPDQPHYESTMDLVEKRDNLYILYGPPNRTLTHHTRGTEFVFEERSVELYFNDRWYTVACVIDAGGCIDSYYCNIAMPCILAGNEAHFIDMDLDVILQKDLSYEVIDREEFEEHKVIFGYPEDLVAETEMALKVLIEDIESRSFPFDGFIEEVIQRLNLK